MKPIRATGGAWGCLSLATLDLTRKWGNQLAGGQIIQGAEAAAQLDVAQAVLAIERSKNSSAERSPFFELQSTQQETRLR